MDRLIELSVQKMPQATALISRDAACRLAKYLEQAGIRRGQLVPICFEKSPGAVITMVALWKLGAAYVPLDPAHPLQHIAIVSASNKILVQDIVRRVITVDPTLLSATDVVFESRSQPRDTAFVIFTSGSTGRPKGVVHVHSAVCSSALRHGPAMSISQATRALQFGSYTFIVSTFELFTPLIFGGSICIPSEQDRQTDIQSALRAFKVNWAIFTPSFARSLSTEDTPLHTLVLAGEPVQDDIMDRWAPKVDLISIYGTSECSVCITGRMVHGQTPRNCIGRATGSLSWIVDPMDHNRLLPIGAVGELVIEGPSLAQGYLGEPDRTQFAFIEDPSWVHLVGPKSLQRRRFYKTGDLARYYDDGTVHLVGRADMQVKVRGQRVELAEIESHLCQMSPSISLKFAVSLIFPRGTPMLAAFIARQSGFGPEFPYDFSHKPEPASKAELLELAMQLSKRLAMMLPSYMIPAVFLPLAYMPLTASGKMDRRKLATFGSTLSHTQLAELARGMGRIVPLTAMEMELESLWSRVLVLRPGAVGADDNFFHWGGDSIQAIRLSQAARRQGFVLAVQDILANPTLSDMAKHMTPTIGSGTVDPRPFELFQCNVGEEARAAIAVVLDLEEGTEKLDDAYPCTPLQEGLMALSAKLSGSYVARHTLNLPATISTQQFQDAWQRVVDSHAALRTRIAEVEGFGMIQAVLSGPIKWQKAEDLESYLTLDEQRPMWMGDPLARHAIIQSNNHSALYHYVLTIHHAIYDGLSLPILLQDLNEALRGTGIKPRPQFNSFIRYVLASNREDAQQFWKSELSSVGLATFPVLPSKTYSPLANASFQYRISLQRKTRSDFTTATLIKAAWGLLLARYNDSPQAVFGCAVSGRISAVSGVEDIVGPVLATVPVKIELDQQQLVEDFLCGIQAQYIAMIPFQDYGLQNIAQLSSGASAACNFQTLLVIQPADSQVDKDIFVRPFSAPRANFTTIALSLECSLSAESIHLHCPGAAYGPAIRACNLAAQLQDPMSPFWYRAHQPRRADCVHHLVKKQTMRQPNTPAVCSWDGDVTYAELDYYSSKLAVHLLDIGVGAKDFVPICFEKSMWVIVAILGIMRAGGAFVPLGPDTPYSRLVMATREVGAHFMVCSKKQLHRFPDLVDRTVPIGPGFNALVINTPMPVLLLPAVTPTGAAYMVFISGSTGMPKGIVMEHQVFCTSALCHKEGFIVEIPFKLLHGGCVTVDPGSAPLLEVLCLTGEVISTTLIETWAPCAHLVNAYGPSECCAASSKRDVIIGSNLRNIGTAIGTACWVIDYENHHQLSPMEKTAETFVPRPTWLPWGSCGRLYKTKDLVRYVPDGSMWLLGRKGYSVKFHGQRVELGEIEYNPLGLILPVHMASTIWIVIEKILTLPSSKINLRLVDIWLAKVPSDFQPAMDSVPNIVPSLSQI
ncbi:nonribosomal peptide synthetase 9 [Bipolaris maydis]|nr:nonribosomal peptide synthetase 9 [Bipolaris maydis]